MRGKIQIIDAISEIVFIKRNKENSKIINAVFMIDSNREIMFENHEKRKYHKLIFTPKEKGKITQIKIHKIKKVLSEEINYNAEKDSRNNVKYEHN